MQKSKPIRDRHSQCLFRPFRGGKDKPLKKRISRDYGRGLINDHIRDDVRPDRFLHAHARRRRAANPPPPANDKVGWDYPATATQEKTDAPR